MIMGVIKTQAFGVTSEVVKDLLEGHEEEWRRRGIKYKRWREVACIVAYIVIVVGGGLRVEEVYLALLEGMLKFW